jgi:hypothetical protein
MQDASFPVQTVGQNGEARQSFSAKHFPAAVMLLLDCIREFIIALFCYKIKEWIEAYAAA